MGPDLRGVAERRERRWVVAEYLTPMVNQNVAPEEAAAIYEFFRSKGE